MIKVKFCGLRRPEDIGYVNRCRPDYAGFILAEGFRRTIAAERAGELISALEPGIKPVGVFVNQPVAQVSGLAQKLGLHAVQLHGNEDEEYVLRLREVFPGEVWKAVRAKRPEDIEAADRLPCHRLVIDSFSEAAVGGTGKRIDTGVVRLAKISKPFFIAGGITPENVCEIVNTVYPFGVDVSSGTEIDGVKDLNKMKTVIGNIRKEIS